jgi:DNA-binding protein YbaB
MLRRLDIDPEAFEGRDADLLADLIMSAITEAQRRVTDEGTERSSGSRGLPLSAD